MSREVGFCKRCGQKRFFAVMKTGSLFPWCKSCVVASIDEYVMSGGETDADKAAITRYQAAMADLDDAIKAL